MFGFSYLTVCLCSAETVTVHTLLVFCFVRLCHRSESVCACAAVWINT